MRVSDTKTSGAAAQTEAKIYHEAVRLFWQRGFHGTSLRDIAAASGVQISTIYYYFPSKQDLLFSIMARTMEDLTVTVLRAIDGLDGPVDRVRAAIHGHVRFHAEHAMEALTTDAELRALDGPNRALVVERRDRYEDIFRQILADGVRSGIMAVPDIRLAVFGLMSMCTAVAVWYRADGPLTIDQVADRYTALFLDGVQVHCYRP